MEMDLLKIKQWNNEKNCLLAIEDHLEEIEIKYNFYKNIGANMTVNKLGALTLQKKEYAEELAREELHKEFCDLLLLLNTYKKVRNIASHKFDTKESPYFVTLRVMSIIKKINRDGKGIEENQSERGNLFAYLPELIRVFGLEELMEERRMRFINKGE